MLKKVIKDVESGKVLFYYQENDGVIEVLDIQKYGENDYGYWIVDVQTKDVDLEDLEESLHQILHYSNAYIDKGTSSRSRFTELVEETIEWVPTIKKDVRQLTSQMAIY